MTDEIFLRGNGGADTLEGPSTPGAGVWATYFTAKQGIVATFDPSGPGYRFTVQDGTPAGAAAFSTDTLINIWSLAGGDFDDRFTGGDDAERFLGRAGSDVIDGKGGSDFAEYEESPLAIFVNLASGFALDGYGTTDTLLNIENVRASNRSDYIIGSGAANILLALGATTPSRVVPGPTRSWERRAPTPRPMRAARRASSSAWRPGRPPAGMRRVTCRAGSRT